MSDTPPDRLSADPRSRYFSEAALQRGIGVRFKGVERDNVEEYCLIEGWVRLPTGRSLDRRGRPICFKHSGELEVWFLDAVSKDQAPPSDS